MQPGKAPKKSRAVRWGTQGKQIRRDKFRWFLENAFYKKPGKDLQSAAKLRNRKMYFVTAEKKRPEGTTIFLHTHHATGPSIGDLFNALQAFIEGKYKSAIVSSIGGIRRNEIGRVFLNPTAETYGITFDAEYVKKLNDDIRKLFNKFGGSMPLMKAEIELTKFTIDKFKIRARKVPMKGYEFNEENWRFEKIRKK